MTGRVDGGGTGNPVGQGAAEYSIRVPASTSNLGPGFDVLGLALDLFLHVRFRPGEGPLEVRRTGELAEEGTPTGQDLVVRSLVETMTGNRFSYNELNAPTLPGGELVLESEIPVGRGLGSSAAARVGGHLLGLLLQGAPVERSRVVEWVTAREGHPDNAAPAVLGGLVASARDPDGSVTTVVHPVDPALAWVYAAPPTPLETHASRRALPESVRHQVAVRTAARMAFLLPALARGDGALLARAMDDELHVPYRLPLIPGAQEAVAAGRAAGAWAVTLSGAGSGVMAVCPPERAGAVEAAMARAFEAVSGSARVFRRRLRPWLRGTQWDARP